MHHKQESLAMLSSILPDKPPFIANAATQDAWSAQAVLRRAAWRDDVDVAVRAGQHAGNRTAAGTETQYPLHHGRRIGWMQPGIYHRGLMVGETPNIDRIGNEGRDLHALYAEQSCTAGRNAFFTGMNPLRTGMIPPQLPGSPSYLRPGTPTLAKFLLDLGYNTASSARTISATTPTRWPTAHGFQEFWVTCITSMPMQGVSFPDINKTPTQQTVAPPCKNTPIPASRR